MIYRMTTCLHRYLGKHGNLKGNVHSVFDRAFNILDSNGHLVGVVSSNKDLGPFSMQLSEEKLTNVLQGKQIEFHTKYLEIEGVQYKYDTLELVDLSLSRYKLPYVDKKLINLRDAITYEGSKEGISQLIYSFSDELDDKNQVLNEYSEFIKDRLLSLLQSLANDDLELFLNRVPKVIGFGPGLTPSADDFILGIIIVLYSLSIVTDTFLKRIYEVCQNRTTKISEEMLYHSIHGHVSESYKELIEQLFNESNDDISDEIKKVIEVGSTSGTDFLFGVYCMTSLINKKEA